MFYNILLACRSKIRSITGVPLLYLHGNCPTLEKPSGLTTKFVEKNSEEKLLTSHQENTIKVLKKQAFGEPDPVEPKKSGIGKVKTLSRISSLRSPVGIANTKVFSAFSASASAFAASKLLPEDEAEASAAGAGAGTGAEADEELEDDATELFSSPSL